MQSTGTGGGQLAWGGGLLGLSSLQKTPWRFPMLPHLHPPWAWAPLTPGAGPLVPPSTSPGSGGILGSPGEHCDSPHVCLALCPLRTANSEARVGCGLSCAKPGWSDEAASPDPGLEFASCNGAWTFPHRPHPGLSSLLCWVEALGSDSLGP